MNKHVLWKWDNEVYKVTSEFEGKYRIENIKFGQTTWVNKDEVIVINNM